jgi:hypothetical protein
MAYMPFYDMVDMLYYCVLKKSEERKETNGVIRNSQEWF